MTTHRQRWQKRKGPPGGHSTKSCSSHVKCPLRVARVGREYGPYAKGPRRKSSLLFPSSCEDADAYQVDGMDRRRVDEERNRLPSSSAGLVAIGRLLERYRDRPGRGAAGGGRGRGRCRIRRRWIEEEREHALQQGKKRSQALCAALLSFLKRNRVKNVSEFGGVMTRQCRTAAWPPDDERRSTRVLESSASDADPQLLPHLASLERVVPRRQSERTRRQRQEEARPHPPPRLLWSRGNSIRWGQEGRPDGHGCAAVRTRARGLG